MGIWVLEKLHFWSKITAGSEERGVLSLREGFTRAEVQVRLESAAREELPVSGKPDFSDNPSSFSQWLAGIVWENRLAVGAPPCPLNGNMTALHVIWENGGNENDSNTHTSVCIEREPSLTVGILGQAASQESYCALLCLLGDDQLYLSHCRDTYFRCYLREPQNQMALSPSLVMQLLCRKREEPRSSSQITGTQNTESWWNEFNYQLLLLP